MQISQERASLNSLNKQKMFEFCQNNNLIDRRKAVKSFKMPELKEAAIKFVDSKLEELTRKSKSLAEAFMPAALKELFTNTGSLIEGDDETTEETQEQTSLDSME